MVAQWDASDSTTITKSAGSVTQVASKVNAGNFTLNANGTPTTTTVNGLGAIDLVSSDDEYLATAGNSDFGITDGDITIVGALVIEEVNHHRDSIWAIGDNDGVNANDAHFRALHFGGSFNNQFMGALETEDLGSSEAQLAGGRSRQIADGPYSGNTIHATDFTLTVNWSFVVQQNVSHCRSCLQGCSVGFSQNPRFLALALELVFCMQVNLNTCVLLVTFFRRYNQETYNVATLRLIAPIQFYPIIGIVQVLCQLVIKC